VSPLPWPLIGRRAFATGGAVPPPPAVTADVPPAEPTVRGVTGASGRDGLGSAGLAARLATVPPRPAPTAWEGTRHMWEAGEAAVLDELATLTDRYGPWTAAVHLFSNSKETPDV
jgi:hypothetical protein